MIHFTKMQGAGNDYVYINCLKDTIDNPSELAQRISNRHFGIGSDGLILIMPSSICDFRMRMFNADGSEAEMCGNASRCIGKYVYDNKLTQKKELTLETKAGIKKLVLHTTNNVVDSVEVDMGEPILKGMDIPVCLDTNSVVQHLLDVNGEKVHITCVSMGNPHAIIYVEDVNNGDLERLGPIIEVHPFFPQHTNVEFVQIISPNLLKMRVWERGAGETLACGTGACATLVATVLNEKCDRKATLLLPGGSLSIEWKDNNHVYMTGGAVKVFEGIIE